MNPQITPASVSHRRKALFATVLILLGYAGAVGHAIGMDHAQTEDCPICLQLKTQGHGLIPAAHVVLQPTAFNTLLITDKIVFIPANFLAIPHARAPPADTN